jgi:hypothetical protein
MISGQEPERPSAAMRSSSAFFSRPADLGGTHARRNRRTDGTASPAAGTLA